MLSQWQRVSTNGSREMAVSHEVELTAAGTVQDFHLIPSPTVVDFVRLSPKNRVQNYTIFLFGVYFVCNFFAVVFFVYVIGCLS